MIIISYSILLNIGNEDEDEQMNNMKANEYHPNGRHNCYELTNIEMLISIKTLIDDLVCTTCCEN